MEPAGHQTAREPGVFSSLDGVLVGWRRASVQRHASAGPRGHRGKKRSCLRRVRGFLNSSGSRGQAVGTI